jgi:hypothetical protein
MAELRHFQRWSQRGLPQQLVNRLRTRLRVRARRDAQPSAAVVDSQSVKAADTVGNAGASLALSHPDQSQRPPDHFAQQDLIRHMYMRLHVPMCVHNARTATALLLLRPLRWVATRSSLVTLLAVVCPSGSYLR